VLGPDDAPVGRVVDVLAMTGAGPGTDLVEPEALFQVCIPPNYWRPSLMVYQVGGDSMEPVIRKGAFVGIDTDRTRLTSGQVYVVNVPYEGLTLKRVFYDPEAECLVLRSANPDHPDQRLPTNGRDDLLVGKAIWVMQEI
jgi:phage repressor protein C with HTH and peptisase S24 domain